MKKLTAALGCICLLALAGCETTTTTTTTTETTKKPSASMDPSIDNTRSTTMQPNGPR